MEEILDNDLDQVTGNAPVITKDTAIYKFSNLNPQELTEKFEVFIKNKGYTLEEGVPGTGTYGKGNKIMRILFGAFVKRFAWKVAIIPVDGYTELSFSKGTKGYAGGAIGVSQVNTEFKSITNSLTQFHASQEGN